MSSSADAANTLTRVTSGAAYTNGTAVAPAPATVTTSCSGPAPGPGGARHDSVVKPTVSVTVTPVHGLLSMVTLVAPG
jgi:hypothetical protein